MKKRRWFIILFLLPIATNLSCEKKNQVQKPSKNVPAWVEKCETIISDPEKKYFYGCGVSSAQEREETLIQKADANAKADLEKKIETYVSSFFQEFLNSPSVQSRAQLTNLEKEFLLQVFPKEVSWRALYGFQVIDRFRAGNYTLYSLGRISFDTFRQAIETQIKVHSSELKMEPLEALEEVSRELEKYRQSHN